ncbi:MAG TPA: type I-U CRISPR-associated protein Csb2 [Phycisphaerales bacterium]|nr:type I-U CRISPR-associated protein Csb2 [Phycisphaerales bacterium]HMP36005.1 type I-U CRISPR-associated protein Csb2 [Phycisphaerales bacterium]
MAGLVIGWEYLTGYAVATDHANRDRAEWPPHPARVFMALAAAWFETGEDPAEGSALRWLETLGDPELIAPALLPDAERTVVTAFVPVNDQIEASNAPLQSVPSMTRVRQPRTFPKVWIGDEPCLLQWHQADGLELHREALGRLCRKVTRIGHSSSVVAIWLLDDPADPEREPDGLGILHQRWRAAEPEGELSPGSMLRSGGRGTLDALARCVDVKTALRAADLDRLLPELEASRKAIRGAGSKERKLELDAQIAALRDERARTEPRPPQRPRISRFVEYHPVRSMPPASSRTCFDSDLVILAGEDDGAPSTKLGLPATLAVCRALRALLLKLVEQPAPPWLSGHSENGEPNRSADGCHLACFPLAHLGHRHADGALLGIALALPRSLDRGALAAALRPTLIDPATGVRRTLRLLLGRLGTWSVTRRDPNDTRRSLHPERWTAAPDGAVVWGSVTPVVLDRFPKADRLVDPEAWRREAAAIVVAACARIGLPQPEEVDLDTTAFVRGVPRSIARQLRRRDGALHGAATMRDGDGFPAYPSRGTAAARPQLHVRLRFAEPVVGPVLLGVGRHNGYGLCMPLPEAAR